MNFLLKRLEVLAGEAPLKGRFKPLSHRISEPTEVSRYKQMPEKLTEMIRMHVKEASTL